MSPVIYIRRTATQSCELAGTPIDAGDKVVMYYGSANRDECAFAEPDRFDVGPGRVAGVELHLRPEAPAG